MGILFVAQLFVPRLNKEWRFDALMERAGTGGPVVAGAAFAFAWTPCIGPALAGILGVAATTSCSAAQGAGLLAVYSAGLAIPFLLTALAFARMTTAFAVVKRHYPVIMAFGGVILVAMGVLIWTGELYQLNIEAQKFLDDLNLNFFQEV
jgi:cytochrome c-type biogenesis protein